jgi:hypothetical protein
MMEEDRLLAELDLAIDGARSEAMDSRADTVGFVRPAVRAGMKSRLPEY